MWRKLKNDRQNLWYYMNSGMRSHLRSQIYYWTLMPYRRFLGISFILIALLLLQVRSWKGVLDVCCFFFCVCKKWWLRGDFCGENYCISFPNLKRFPFFCFLGAKTVIMKPINWQHKCTNYTKEDAVQTYSWHLKNKSLYIRMYWMHLWHPTVRARQIFLKKLI